MRNWQMSTALAVIALSAAAWAMPTDYQPADGTYYKVSNQVRGTGMNLDVVNGGARNNEILLSPDGNFSGQLWHIAQAPGQNYYTLKTQFGGENMCLDINLPSMRPHLNTCGNYTGQHWHIVSSHAGPDFRALYNDTQGNGTCLDINRDDNAVEMRPCNRSAGQAWMFVDTGKSTP